MQSVWHMDPGDHYIFFLFLLENSFPSPLLQSLSPGKDLTLTSTNLNLWLSLTDQVNSDHFETRSCHLTQSLSCPTDFDTRTLQYASSKSFENTSGQASQLGGLSPKQCSSLPSRLPLIDPLIDSAPLAVQVAKDSPGVLLFDPAPHLTLKILWEMFQMPFWSQDSQDSDRPPICLFSQRHSQGGLARFP